MVLSTSDIAWLRIRVAGVPPNSGLPHSGNCSLFRQLSNSRVKDRLILTALAFALVFVSVHFVLHDLDEATSDLNVQDECQVCRLSHVPVASDPGLFLFEPLRVVAYVLPTKTVWSHDLLRFPTLGARAPPLF